jgi:glyoxylase-like metal-dependent hydrolase (beta-lactamase superfamily II)
VLYGSKRTLKISTARKAHSPGDSFAILQDDGVCFTGDLMFNRIHPWLGTGDPDNLVAVLGRIYNADIEFFVPGHGDIAYKDDIIIQIEYINEMKKLVKGKMDMKNPRFSVMELPAVYHDWNPLCFSWNTDFLLEKYRR